MCGMATRKRSYGCKVSCPWALPRVCALKALLRRMKPLGVLVEAAISAAIARLSAARLSKRNTLTYIEAGVVDLPTDQNSQATPTANWPVSVRALGYHHPPLKGWSNYFGRRRSVTNSSDISKVAELYSTFRLRCTMLLTSKGSTGDQMMPCIYARCSHASRT